ncbi:MAG: hypothetical protein KAJ07_00375 [Planctomycetes bacterium]|nr:hypothetical protein [Planctomycetota bacterium]
MAEWTNKDVARYEYHVGLDYIHIYDNAGRDNSENPFAVVFSEEDASKIVDALNA